MKKLQQESSQFVYNYSAADYPENIPKNRFNNVKAADHSRVKLNGGEGTDYINANFLSGLVRGSEKCYIATQGPLESTIGDFLENGVGIECFLCYYAHS
jgi:protein tyrosine phosphatase